MQINSSKDYVVRIHLKTSCSYRARLIHFCLGNPRQQYLAIGWSFLSSGDGDYQSYFDAVCRYQKDHGHKKNPTHTIFAQAQENDLFWTRDLSGCYWICRAQGPARSFLDQELDIGAVLPVEAHQYGLEVPGQIKAAFNHPRGSTAQRIRDKVILEWSKAAFNACAGRAIYQVTPTAGSLLDNLPEFELEELVISYIQVQYNYYLLSNSIASHSTTVAIECEFRTRDPRCPGRAVVQVKGGRDRVLTASDYQDFLDGGYRVFLYAPHYNKDRTGDIIYIARQDLMDFYQNYKQILPTSITQWEDLFAPENSI